MTGMAIADVVGRGKKRGKAVGSTLSRPENTSLFLRKEKDQKEIGVFLYLDFFQRIAQKKRSKYLRPRCIQWRSVASVFVTLKRWKRCHGCLAIGARDDHLHRDQQVKREGRDKVVHSLSAVHGSLIELPRQKCGATHDAAVRLPANRMPIVSRGVDCVAFFCQNRQQPRVALTFRHPPKIRGTRPSACPVRKLKCLTAAAMICLSVTRRQRSSGVNLLASLESTDAESAVDHQRPRR